MWGSAEPFFFLYDTLNPSFPYSVANHSPCRNNFDNNIANFLESVQNNHIFASDLRFKIHTFWLGFIFSYLFHLNNAFD